MRAITLSAAALLVAGPAAAEFTLTVLHTNDLHSRLEPINQYDSTCPAEDDAAGACFGGVARLKTAIDQARAEAEAEGRALLLLDAGDQFQGSLFYTTYKGEAAAEFMETLGYDAMAVGNHEFDDGPETLAAFIERVGFPVLSANIDASDDAALAGLIAPHAVLEVGGERIGLIGATARDTAELSSPGEDVAFSDPVEAVREAAAALEAEGVSRIVALTHVGHGVDLEIARVVPAVDLVVGGHTNTLLGDDEAYPVMVEGEGGDVTPVVQAYAYGKYLGEVTLTFDEAGEVVSAEGAPRLLDASVEPDAELAARVAELAGPIEDLKAEVIGEAATPIDGSRETCRAGECAMGVLVAEAMLAASGADIAIQNGGGLRASIDGGPVTMGEVLTVLPFQNTLATFTLTGAELVEALENGVSQVEEGAGRFPQVAGLRFVWNPAKPAGERVVEVEVATGSGWSPIDRGATYEVVSNNFMRGGGDGYAVFAEQGRDAYDYGPGLEQVVADHIAAASPVAPETDGRIRRVE